LFAEYDTLPSNVVEPTTVVVPELLKDAVPSELVVGVTEPWPFKEPLMVSWCGFLTRMTSAA